MLRENILRPIMGRSINKLNTFSSFGQVDIVAGAVVNNLTHFNSFQPFSNRICSIRWIPRRPNSLLVGGKHGELCFVSDVNKYTISGNEEENVDMISPGIGPGGEIREIVPDQIENSKFYSLNVSGELVKVDLTTRDINVIQPQGDFHVWFGGCNVNFDKQAIFLGDNKGKLHILPDSSRGSNSDRTEVKVAKTGKINHIEFHPRDSNFMAISSTSDCSVKLWDIRKLKDLENIEVLLHDKGVSSCYFNSNGSKIVTTDQGNELKVFSSGDWSEIASINHPHRHYQYITPIRAEWHPLADLIVVGRYPNQRDKNQRKTVDFFDGRDGSPVQSLDIPSQKISSLNRFNCMGDILATMFQTDIIIWKQNYPESKSSAKNLKPNLKRGSSDMDSDDDDEEDDDDLKKKKVKGKAKKAQAKPKLPPKNTKKKR